MYPLAYFEQVVQAFSDKCDQYLNLTVGEFVFIVRHTAEWYYGFKSTDSSTFGAFPKLCVCIGKNDLLCEVSAEMQMMFAELLLLYKNNSHTQLAKVTPTIWKIIEVKQSLSRKVTEYELFEGIRVLLTWVSLGQRELSLPITLRDDDLKSIDPYSKSTVDLNICHRKFLRHIIDPKTTSHWPTSQLFSLHISFTRLPQAEFTVFLASQAIIRQNENAPLCPTITNVDSLTIERRISDPNGSVTAQLASSCYQVAPAVSRLTENVVLNCYESSSQDVLFTDLDPFQPTEERLLLMVLVNRMGPMQIKRPKPTKIGRDGSTTAVELPNYRRPVGVACVDITRLVISHLNRSGCSEASTRLLDGSSMTAGVQTPRLVTVITTGEQFQTDSLLSLAKHTPLAYFAKLSGREVTAPIPIPSTLNALIDIPATSSLAAGLPVGTAVTGLATATLGTNIGGLTSNSSSGITSSTSFTASSNALFSGSADELDFILNSIEVLDPRESQILMHSAPTKPRIYCGRRFGFSNMLSVGAESDRRELFVTLISGEFNKGTKKQEKNVEIEISVRDSSGNLLNWQSKERTMPPVFHSTVYYHKNHPRWSELFTVTLPSSTTGKLRTESRLRDSGFHGMNQLDEDRSASEPGELACAHLRLVCRHRSGGIEQLSVSGMKEGSSPIHVRVLPTAPFSPSSFYSASKDKLLGVAFLRLQPSTAIPVLLADGCYQLLIHKMDMHHIDTCAYLRETSCLPGTGPGPMVSAGSGSSMGSSGSHSSNGAGTLLGTSALSSFSQSKQRSEMLVVETRVCSSQHTTDEHLTKVLLWRRYQEDMVMCLRQGIYLSRKYVELQKFTRSLMDNLLQMLCTTVDHSGPNSVLNVSLGYSVLMALAKCYHDLLIKPAYQDLIDAYLKGTAFNYSTAHYPYIRLLNSILRDLLDDNMAAEDNNPESPFSGNDATDPSTFFFKHTTSITRDLTSGSGHIDEKAIEMIFSTVGWAFRVIVRSRQLELESLSEKADSSGQKQIFVRQMDEFLSYIVRVAALTNHSLPLKIVNAVSQIIRDVSLVYPRDRLSRSIVILLERMIDFPESPNRKLLLETIESQLFEDPDCRVILMPAIRQTMTKFFSDMLSKQELSPNRLEKHMVMELWCDSMLTFISRFTLVTQRICQYEERQFGVVSSQSEQSYLSDGSHRSSACSDKHELYEALVQSGFVRWIMQQLGRMFIFVHEQESSARSSSQLEEPQLRTGHALVPCSRFASAARAARDKQAIMETKKQSASVSQRSSNTALRLQDICGCLTSVLLTLLDQFDPPLWHSLLAPSADDFLGMCAASCLCSVCSGLSLVPVFDFVHELVSLFSMMHTYPAYPAPKRTSIPIPHNVPVNNTTEDCLDEALSVRPHNKNNNNKHPIEFGGAWVQMLMAASTVELRVLRTIIEVTLTPMFVANTSENCVQSSGNRCTLSSDSVRMMAEHTFTTELVNLVQHCLGSFVVQQSHLCVEALPAVLRTRVDQSLYGRAADLRELACDSLVVLWDAMSERSKAFYIPMILPTVIDMTTVPLSKIRENCVNLIFDAIQVSPSRVERVFVSEIDRVMQWAGTGFAADMYRLLGDRFRSTDPIQLDTRRQRLITDLLRQIECLLNYGEFLNHPSRLSEMLALHNLRSLYESIGRKDMMLHYLYRLEGLHAEDGNVTERGYTLQMISRQYTREQAELYERVVIANEPRLTFYYYLLTLHGPGFASFLTERTNCLIYRTQAKLINLVNILHEQFPQATVLNNPPEPGHVFDHPCIFPSGNVKPVPVLPAHVAARGVDARIKSYYLHNRVECFTYLRPITRPALGICLNLCATKTVHWVPTRNSWFLATFVIHAWNLSNCQTTLVKRSIFPLIDSVLELLELQLAGLETWYR
ncbi:hypothetical protein FGIG_05728 [Fasciola gigantica]|uniref:C2 DOCK-type domain-containing protein n=1 Tax=Fasciola gigantica TaxID=46835 RepID=A0A504Z5P5_FASGI|nr:hypothetical protein FGIG_05728 [Fasciola gigantica]